MHIPVNFDMRIHKDVRGEIMNFLKSIEKKDSKAKLLEEFCKGRFFRIKIESEEYKVEKIL
jgi:ABC-type phosphate/phosphonate transport system substrate-binding protein